MKLEKIETFNKWIMIWNVKREKRKREEGGGGKRGREKESFMNIQGSLNKLELLKNTFNIIRSIKVKM